MMKFFKYLVMGIAGLVAIALGMAVLGIAISLAVLAIKIGVVVLIGYGIFRLLGGGRKSDAARISDADRKWLES
jgi:hypothetical protein